MILTIHDESGDEVVRRELPITQEDIDALNEYGYINNDSWDDLVVFAIMDLKKECHDYINDEYHRDKMREEIRDLYPEMPKEV